MNREYKIEEGVTVGGFVNAFLEAAKCLGMKDLNGILNNIKPQKLRYIATDLTNMKLQKLLYITYGLYCLGEKKALFSVDKIQSWQYGPVFPEVYHDFKYLNNNPIDFRKIDEYKFKNETISKEIGYTVEACAMVVLEDLCLKNKSTSELADMTHSDYSLWNKEFQEKNILSGQEKFDIIVWETVKIWRSRPEKTNN